MCFETVKEQYRPAGELLSRNQDISRFKYMIE